MKREKKSEQENTNVVNMEGPSPKAQARCEKSGVESLSKPSLAFLRSYEEM